MRATSSAARTVGRGNRERRSPCAVGRARRTGGALAARGAVGDGAGGDGVVIPIIARTIEALTFLELELEDSAPIDRLRLLAMVRQALADLASLEVPAPGC